MPSEKANAESSELTPVMSDEMESSTATKEAPAPVDLGELGAVDGGGVADEGAGEEPPQPTLDETELQKVGEADEAPAPGELADIAAGGSTDEQPVAPTLGAVEEEVVAEQEEENETPPEPFPIDELEAMEK